MRKVSLTDSRHEFYLAQENQRQSINGDERPAEELSNFNCFNFWRDPLPEICNEVEQEIALSEPNLSAYNNYFKSRSYAIGFTLSLVDFELFKTLDKSDMSQNEFPYLSRWHRHIASHDVYADPILSMVDLEPWLKKIIQLGEVKMLS